MVDTTNGRDKYFVTKYNWPQIKKRFFESKHETVSSFLKENEGFTGISTYAREKTRGWAKDKKSKMYNELLDLATKPNAEKRAIQKLIDSKFKLPTLSKLDKNKKEVVQRLKTVSSATEIKSSAKLAKVSALKTIVGMILLMEQDMENGLLKTSDFLKFSPNLIDLIKQLESVEAGEFGTKDFAATKDTSRAGAKKSETVIRMASDKDED